MDFSEALRYILDGDAVLFLGTGFSSGAHNYSGNEFLTPSRLANLLYSAVNIPETEQNGDLGQASDIYLEEKSPFELIELLKDQYTVSSISNEQTYIGSKRWRRIYTTNYDNVLEKAFENNRRRLNSAVLSQKPSFFSNKDGMCIHLNGSITNLSPEKLGTEFKLTNRSYLEDAFLENEWMSFFRSDLRTAKVILFIGYSMKYDLDLKRIIFNTNGTKEKTFFVVSKNESSLNLHNLNRFGTPLTIGLDGLVEELTSLEKTYRPIKTLPPILFSFERFDISYSPVLIQDADVFKLFVNGDFAREKIFYSINSQNDYPYYIFREKVKAILEAIESGDHNILVHSDLGNGKTLFVNGLACCLVNQGYSVYFYHRYEVSTDREIEEICSSHDKSVIIIDGYADKFEVIKTISRCRTDQIIVLSERSAILDITYDDVETLLGEFLLCDVNRLTASELKSVDSLFMRNGLWGGMSARRKGRIAS